MPQSIPELPRTLGELRRSAFPESSLARRTVKDELRANLIRKIRNREPLFPGVVGYEDSVVPHVVNAVLSRHNFILLGLRGQAKTRLIRQLTTLLDPHVPYISGCEIHDNPYAPICRRCKQLLAETGDATPIAWLTPEERYVEKLATPDVTIADMIGDIDPIKAARRGQDISDELTVHYGLIPRANRGIFAINELPDLAGRIQVGLFNIMQEGDVQIKGYPVRLPLDLLLAFTASVVAIVRYVSFRRLRLRMLRLEQQSALERERARIARDMHDEVGAKLTRLSLLSEMAGGNPDLPATASGDVKEISDTARETIRSFEEVVWAVNPRNDTLADLVNYLCRYAEDYFDGSLVRCVFDLPPEMPNCGLPTEVRHQVFLAAKEAFTNVLKHANARRVRVQLALAGNEFKIIIEDDGAGFDVAAPPKRAGGGNGLGNMKERLRSVGGQVECTSTPGQGTRIVFQAPRNPEAAP